MAQKNRLLIAMVILIAISGVLVAADMLRRQAQPALAGNTAVTLTAGSIPIYMDGQLVAGFSPGDLDQLKKASFIEAAEGVKQEGWMLRDILLLYIPEEELRPDTQIVVSSSSRGKSAQLTWEEVNTPENYVMFDLANRGTLKLVSVMEKLDERAEWVQDSDRIEISSP